MEADIRENGPIISKEAVVRPEKNLTGTFLIFQHATPSKMGPVASALTRRQRDVSGGAAEVFKSDSPVLVPNLENNRSPPPDPELGAWPSMELDQLDLRETRATRDVIVCADQSKDA